MLSLLIFYPSGQTRAQMNQDFYDIRHRFNSRYIRLYGACDREGF